MSKFVRTAALVVGAVVAVAAAIPTGGTSLLAVGLGVSTATASTIAAGVGLATSLIASATAKKPSAQATGSQTQFTANPDAGIPCIIGRTAPAGFVKWSSV